MHKGTNDYAFTNLHVRRDGVRPSNPGSFADTDPSALAAAPGEARLTVGICETQPITIGGLRALLSANDGFAFAWASESLPTALQLARTSPPSILLLDKAFGLQTVLDALAEIQAAGLPCATVVWGMSVSEAEALRFIQAGARGIVRKSADPQSILSCLASVDSGSSWMQDYVFRESFRPDRDNRSDLTAREQQVLELVEHGMKNKEIAQQLGIRPGTVKIHLKHIFEKTGVRGRYGLALASLKDRVLEAARHQASLGNTEVHAPAPHPTPLARPRPVNGQSAAAGMQGPANGRLNGVDQWRMSL
ncbi:MAG TPA: hypothetical protein DEH78_27295 [Solibacterales bacterium]|nr:hypothetical protein [Bryobacterales bacterium]